MNLSAQTEMERIKALADYNLSYDELKSQFNDLTLLASQIAATPISLVNLIDAYNLWTIGAQGIDLSITDREETVCQYTIQEPESLEVENLADDPRFSQRGYVTNGGLRYYFGVPLITPEGHAIGSLCIFDSQMRHLSVDQKSMLKTLGETIVYRLESIKQIELLKTKNRKLENEKRMVAHDIRGPVSGIIGLAKVVTEQGEDNDMEEVLEFMKLIEQSGNSVLELASDILNSDSQATPANVAPEHLTNLIGLKDKVAHLFTPRVKDKGIDFQINLSPDTNLVPFAKGKLQQIIGNLVSNAIKFTPVGGRVTLNMDYKYAEPHPLLELSVIDTGVGMSAEKVNEILNGGLQSTTGTSGEIGYGLGLGLVKQLVAEYGGHFALTSLQGSGSAFKVTLPMPVN
ncbi:GAF domain-containing sensor histidine kinase [Mucilaginibacter sp. Bleaf8]|uniref:GAF domain-containing sensor histidine kinase n=1 Tax=Mucilaginibacter sp. Bleaf8 TaxID=2834430 RepID=UPI001BCC85D0|nr:GAF domain-containing sensor histidine kinase [Mucilaginibacter sp. Bleaf8]MBS7564834.1 GAF domain-containing sensor histidine kinase [Mucilaginibacter sp. Bleaf8]